MGTPSVNDFTTGWIATSPSIFKHARTMADQMYPNCSIEHSIYILGRYGEENVTLQLLPNCGHPLRLSVDKMTRAMASAFPKIRQILVLTAGPPVLHLDNVRGDFVIGLSQGFDVTLDKANLPSRLPESEFDWVFVDGPADADAKPQQESKWVRCSPLRALMGSHSDDAVYDPNVEGIPVAVIRSVHREIDTELSKDEENACAKSVVQFAMGLVEEKAAIIATQQATETADDVNVHDKNWIEQYLID